jgi:hypothetical protein
MKEEDDHVSENICKKDERTIDDPCPHIQVLLVPGGPVDSGVSECDCELMEGHFHIAESNEGERP